MTAKAQKYFKFGCQLSKFATVHVSCQTLPKMLSSTRHIKGCAAILNFKRFSFCFLEQHFVSSHINKHFFPAAACSRQVTFLGPVMILA